MPLRFTARRAIASIADLPTESEKAQLRHAGKLYAGLRAQLGPAMVEAKLLPPSDLSYAEFKALLDQQ